MAKTNPLEYNEYIKRTNDRKEDIRPPYYRDQTAIIHSMAFRRLKHKTQVFFSPENDHVCTRIEHVLHVASIASTICKGLNKAKTGWELNEDLAYAIGLGHDIGHAPFGHSGEKKLNQLMHGGKRFIHEVNSYRVVEKLANSGEGLNLTYAVKDGIICHCGEKWEQEVDVRKEIVNLDNIDDRSYYPATWEGCIVRFSDKIAYLGRDIEDAITAKFFGADSIPNDVKKVLGSTNKEIINSLVLDLVDYSKNNDKISFSKEKHEAILKLRDFNNTNIYRHAMIERWQNKGEKIIEIIYNYLNDLYTEKGYNPKKYKEKYSNNLDQAFGNYLEKMENFYKEEKTSPQQIIIDYIAGMTDEYALKWAKAIIIPAQVKFKQSIDN